MSNFFEYILDYFRKDNKKSREERKKEEKLVDPYKQELSEILSELKAYHLEYVHYSEITEDNASIVDNIAVFFKTDMATMPYEKKMDVYREMYIYLDQWVDFFKNLHDEESSTHYFDDGYYLAINAGFTPLYIKLLSIKFDLSESEITSLSNDFITLNKAYNLLVNYATANNLKESNKASSFSSF